MRHSLLLFILLLSFSSVNGQEKETRTVDAFTNISVASGIDLYLRQGAEVNVEVECKKDDIHRLKTVVEGNTLKIYMKGSGRWSWSKSTNPKVYVTFEELIGITASGGSDVYGQNSFLTQALKVNSSGGSDLYLDVTVTSLKLSSSGGSDIKIKGSAEQLVANASSGSDINAKELKAQKVKITSSGGSDAIVWAVKEIVADASGGSDITYYGEPEVKQLNESGAGDISHR